MNNEAEYSVSADESSYVCVAQEVKIEVEYMILSVEDGDVQRGSMCPKRPLGKVK